MHLQKSATAEQRREAHKAKMASKKARRPKLRQYRVLPASLNWRNGKPHKHAREIARWLRRGEG